MNELKLNYGRTCLIGLAFMGISAFWQLYDNIVPLILKNSFELEETITGIVMAADNVLAVLLLPLLGAWSDRVDTRFGKRMPFIFAGTLLSVFFMLLIPIADNERNLGLFILGLGAVLISMGLYRSPAVALMPDLTPPKLRSQGNAVINVMGALGAITALVLIQVLVSHEAKPDYLPLFATVAGIMLVALILLLATVREKELSQKIAEEYPEFAAELARDKAAASAAAAEAKNADSDAPRSVSSHLNSTNHGRDHLDPAVSTSLTFALLVVFLYYMSYNGITTAFSRYAQEVWGLAGGSFALSLIVVAVSAFVSYIPLGILAARVGRKKVIALGFVMMLSTFVVMSFVTEYHVWINFWFVFVGVGGSAVGVNIFPVVVDMCPNNDLGKYTGMYYTFSMTAQIVTPIASGFLLEHVSYLTLFPYAAVFTLLGLLALMRVHHGDSVPSPDLLADLQVD